MPKIKSNFAIIRTTADGVQHLLFSDTKPEGIDHHTDRLLEQVEVTLPTALSSVPATATGQEVVFDYWAPAHKRYIYKKDDKQYRPKKHQLFPSINGEVKYLYGFIERIYRTPLTIEFNDTLNFTIN